jgi:hypothetical protein
MPPRCLLGLWTVSAMAFACEGTPTGSSDPAAVHVAPAEAPAAPPAPEEDTRPLVELSGRSRPASVAIVAPGQPRVYARQMRVWVHEQPSAEARRLGYLRAGASSPTVDPPAGTAGCPGGWRPVAPRGYVCVGAQATLDPDDPIVVATREHPPDHLRKLPYIYGTVRRPGPVYARLPEDDEVRAAEPGFEERMEKWLEAGGEIGARYAQHVWLGHPGQPPDPAAQWRERVTQGVPAVFASGKTLPSILGRPRDPGQLRIETMGTRVGYSLLHTFFWRGRRYGLTAQLEVVPTDRLRPIQGSDFHGFEIGTDVEFPFAIVRHPSARFVTYQASTDRVIAGESAPYRAAFSLTGKQAFFKGVLHYETKEGRWLSDRHASRLDPAKKMPGWALKGERWIDINLTKQTLMLYEGENPVYATLVSTGEAGLGDPRETTATKRGIFRVHTKHVTATMASREIGEEFELRDVPYVQYFDKEGYAIHGAYWHDRFGIPKSHGCINLSPEDARRVFYFTEPRVPKGWHGALLPLEGTVVFIHP